MTEVSDLDERTAELRRAFDRAFASPPAAVSVDTEDLLAIRVGGDPHTIRLRDVSGIVADRRIVGIPAAAAGLLGLAGVRGEIVPVFALSSILGSPPEAHDPRWMVLSDGPRRIGLAFSQLDGYLRLPRASFHPESSLDPTHPFVREVAATEEGARPVVDVPAIVEMLGRRTRQQSHEEERSP